jgi:hypothetical protein
MEYLVWNHYTNNYEWITGRAVNGLVYTASGSVYTIIKTREAT